jgi:hypothetical protein
MAFWQVAYPNSLRSAAITLDYFNEQCATAFGLPGMVPPVEEFNNKYRGWESTATSVFATNGGDDPWQGATMNATLTPGVYVENTAHCDGCGHCGDLHGASSSDPPQLTAQRAALVSQLTSWIVPA